MTGSGLGRVAPVLADCDELIPSELTIGAAMKTANQEKQTNVRKSVLP